MNERISRRMIERYRRVGPFEDLGRPKLGMTDREVTTRLYPSWQKQIIVGLCGLGVDWGRRGDER